MATCLTLHLFTFNLDPGDLEALADDEDMPPELKEGQFDIFLLFCEEDHIEALKFVHFLETELRLRVCYVGKNFMHKQNQFDRLEEAINRSLYTFIFVTNKLVNDNWTRYKHDAALAESIHTNGEFVVPVRAEGCKVPFSLQPLTALRIYHVIDDLPDHPDYIPKTEGQPTPPERDAASVANAAKQIPFVRNQIIKLVYAKDRLKKRRLQMDEEKKKEWKGQEGMRKYQETLQKQLEMQRKQLEQEAQIRAMHESYNREMEKLRMLQSDLTSGNAQNLPNNLAGPFNMFPAMPMNNLAGFYMNNPMQGNMGFPGVNFNYFLPRGMKDADLRPAFNIQAGQVSNLQMGDQNQIYSETTMPPNPVPHESAREEIPIANYEETTAAGTTIPGRQMTDQSNQEPLEEPGNYVLLR